MNSLQSKTAQDGSLASFNEHEYAANNLQQHLDSLRPEAIIKSGVKEMFSECQGEKIDLPHFTPKHSNQLYGKVFSSDRLCELTEDTKKIRNHTS